MNVVTPPKVIGLTLKFVLDLDDETAQAFLEALPGSIRINGKELSADELVVGVGDDQVEPARLWVKVEELPCELEDEFLEC